MIVQSSVSTPSPVVVRSPHAPAPAPVAPAPDPVDGVQIGALPPPAEVPGQAVPPMVSLGQRVSLAGLAALSLVGGFMAAPTAAAAQDARFYPSSSVSRPAPSAVQAAQVVTYNRQQVAETRTYISDMLENNTVQGKGLSTYQQIYQNNYNTLTHIEREIVTHPQAMADPGVHRAYEKIRAALDSLQVFTAVDEDITYQAGTQTLQLPDGSVVTMPLQPIVRNARLRADYAGGVQLTDHTLEQLQQIMQRTSR